MTDQPTPPPPPESNPSVGQEPGGYAPAPSYQSAPAPGAYNSPGSYAAPAGTRAYVEQHFGPVATFGPRAKAGIIDLLISLVPLALMLVGFVLLIAGAPTTRTDGLMEPAVNDDGSTGLLATGVGLMVLSTLLLFAVMLWNRVFRMGRTGQSIGKQVVGLKLIDGTTGQPIGAGKSFLREIVHGLANQIIYLSYLWMLWDDNRQTLGDLAVKSMVIEVSKR